MSMKSEKIINIQKRGEVGINKYIRKFKACSTWKKWLK